jgi:hypothetical protein
MEYIIPTNGPIQIWVMKRFDIYNFFKVNLTSKFLESPVPPSEIIIPSRKRKISNLDETDYERLYVYIYIYMFSFYTNFPYLISIYTYYFPYHFLYLSPRNSNHIILERSYII